MHLRTNDELSVSDLTHLTVPQLKGALRQRGKPTSGNKSSLLRQLVEAINEERSTDRGGVGGD